MFASGIINVISNMFGVATFATNRIDLRSYRELSASLLRAALCIIAYLVFPASIVYIGIVALIVAFFNLAVQFIYTKKLLPGFFPNSNKPTKQHFKDILISSVWSIIVSFGNLLLSGMTILLSNVFYGSSISGTLSIAITIPSFLSGIVTMVVYIFYPVMTDSVAKENHEEIFETIKTVIKLCGGFCIAVIAVFLAVSTNFFELWVPNEDSHELFYLTAMFLAPYITTASFWVFNNLFIAKNEIKKPAILTLLFGGLNIGLFCVLGAFQVPFYFAIIVTIILEMALVGIVFPVLGSKMLPLSLKTYYTIFAKMVLSGFVVFAFSYALTSIVAINSWIKFVIYAIVIGFFGLNIIFASADLRSYLNTVCKIPWYAKRFFSKKGRNKNGD